MCDIIEKERMVCFTGHRSQQLHWRFERCKVMKETLRAELEKV